MLTVYLDQKDWIGATKAIYQKTATVDEQAIVSDLKRYANAGLVRFPISETHFMEAVRIGNQEQRRQLASVFASIGRDWFLASRHARMAYEVESALAMTFDDSAEKVSFDAVRRDFFWAFGDYPLLSQLCSIPVERLKQIVACIEPNVLMSDHLAFDDEPVRRMVVERLSTSASELVSGIEARRKRTRDQPNDVRLQVYSALLFYELQDKLKVALQKIGKTFYDLRALPEERISGIVDLIPCLDVECSLALVAERQREKPIEVNDVYDIAAMTAAIPYCDVVVTEKHWAHLARASNIANKYGTTMLSSLKELHAEVRRRVD